MTSDGVQPEDLERLRVYETRQSVDLLKIQQTVAQLGEMLTSYAQTQGGALDLRQTKHIENGKTVIRLGVS